MHISSLKTKLLKIHAILLSTLIFKKIYILLLVFQMNHTHALKNVKIKLLILIVTMAMNSV